MDTFNELVELLYKRWEIRNHGYYSAESLFIGGKGVWLFLAAVTEDVHAIKPGTSAEKYYLKLHWGKKPSHAVELPANYSVKTFKEGIQWLVSAMGILDLYEEAVEKYLADDKKRLEDWNKHRGYVKQQQTQYKTHVRQTPD
jgi:hypothetical protein